MDLIRFDSIRFDSLTEFEIDLKKRTGETEAERRKGE
jgi:hypothetical protein